ncbi:MAG: sigma-54-dependent Fis family transcriptional regulator [bacterium]|nr:sigma-54-dependent Fis family transcriptional regulator [bacterium]
MFENIKTQLWDILKKKQVSLVMIFDRKGDILWHRGRSIEGKSIHLGMGFSRSFAKKAIADGNAINKMEVDIMVVGDQVSESLENLSLKSLLILPVKQGYYLYVDSGTIEHFNQSDLEVFRVMGELLEKSIQQVMAEEGVGEGVTGKSEAAEQFSEMLIKYSLEEEPILLLGETGVGKSHTAELIHHYSGRKGRFVVAEITSINENLFESTMFGHKKGAFTDARADKPGLVQEADRGTLFIDEISEIPVSFQAKLLRFIEKKKYRVMGDAKEKDADVRIVAASNLDLQEAIAEKTFREDLYYRLHVLEVRIPPLRERKEDIKAFIEHNGSYLKGNEIGEGFWEEILKYQWPGNMRELITVLKRAGILLESPITGEKIKRVIYSGGLKQPAGEPPSPGTWKEDIRAEFRAGKSFWELIKEPYLNRDLNRHQVKTIIADALEKTNGNYKEALPFLNLVPDDYTRFMKFLYRNQLN